MGVRGFVFPGGGLITSSSEIRIVNVGLDLAGVHMITCAVTDSDGVVTQVSVNFTVEGGLDMLIDIS